MTAPFRTPTGGRIDRGSSLEFAFDGRVFTGHPGDTLASALLAHGVHKIATSVKLGRPRGISAASAEDTGGLVQIEAPFPEPMLLASTIELHDGLAARGLPGQGRLADIADSARYDAMHAHADVLIVGAGPAGLAAALSAAHAGARVIVVDEQSEAGGSLLGSTDHIGGATATEWVRAAVAELATYPEVRHLQRTTAFGHYDDGFVLALERRTDHLGNAAPARLSRQRVWRIRARHVVIATGAHERPIVFADNDRPGIMLAHSARTFLRRYGVLVGHAAVVFTTNDSAYAAAFDLADAGMQIEAVVDAREQVSDALRRECDRRGIPVRAGAVVTGTSGTDRITHAMVADYDGVKVAAAEAVSCDTLLLSGGWNPAVHLFSQARGKLRYDPALGGFVPGEQLDGIGVAGAANGVMDLAGCLREGRDSAAAALSELGLSQAESAPLPEVPPAEAAPRPGAVAGPRTRAGSVRRRAARRHRRGCRTGGRRRHAFGRAHQALHHHRHRARPGQDLRGDRLGHHRRTARRAHRSVGHHHISAAYTPVAFAALAGRDRGSCLIRAHHGAARLACRRRCGVRGRRAVEERPRYYRRTRRRHGRRGAARMRGGARPCRVSRGTGAARSTCPAATPPSVDRNEPT